MCQRLCIIILPDSNKFNCKICMYCSYTYVHEYIKVVFKTLCILYLFNVVDYCFSSIQQFILPHINKILFSVFVPL